MTTSRGTASNGEQLGSESYKNWKIKKKKRTLYQENTKYREHE